MKSKEILLDIVFIMLGGFIFAAAVNIFTAPNNIAPGGLTGIGTMVNYLTRIPIGTVIIILNIPIFVWAYKVFGFSYIAKTFFATIAVSVMIDTSARILPAYRGDMMLCAVAGGVLSGVGLSLIFMRGATTGGTDLIAKLVMRRLPHLTLGRLILIIDFIVVLMSAAVYKSLEMPVYAAILIFIMSKVVDGMLYGSSLGNEKMLLIISKENDNIAKMIIKQTERGVTRISAKGVYTGRAHGVLMCAVKRQEVYKIYDIIYSADPKAFIVVSEVDEIIGEGFEKG